MWESSLSGGCFTRVDKFQTISLNVKSLWNSEENTRRSNKSFQTILNYIVIGIIESQNYRRNILNKILSLFRSFPPIFSSHSLPSSLFPSLPLSPPTLLLSSPSFPHSSHLFPSLLLYLSLSFFSLSLHLFSRSYLTRLLILLRFSLAPLSFF